MATLSHEKRLPAEMRPQRATDLPHHNGQEVNRNALRQESSMTRLPAGLGRVLSSGEAGMRAEQNERINPDSHRMLWVTVGLVGFLAITSFAVSFSSLIEVAEWVGLPQWLRWTVPAFIDVAILAYGLAAVIHRSRGESVAATWVSLSVFTAVSVVANALHALSSGSGETAGQQWIGASIAAMAPIAVLASTEELSRLAFGHSARLNSTALPTKISLATESETPPAATDTAGTVEETPLAVAQPEAARAEANRDVAGERPADLQEPDAGETEPSSEESPAVAACPTAMGLEDESRNAAEGELDRLARWARERMANGEELTGAAVGDYLGMTDRTGRNRLKMLRERYPEFREEGVSA
jgi:hypothetical protein